MSRPSQPPASPPSRKPSRPPACASVNRYAQFIPFSAPLCLLIASPAVLLQFCCEIVPQHVRTWFQRSLGEYLLACPSMDDVSVYQLHQHFSTALAAAGLEHCRGGDVWLTCDFFNLKSRNQNQMLTLDVYAHHTVKLLYQAGMVVRVCGRGGVSCNLAGCSPLTHVC